MTTVLIKDMKAMGPQSVGFVRHLCSSYWGANPVHCLGLKARFERVIFLLPVLSATSNILALTE